MYSYKFTKLVEKFLEKQDKDFLVKFKSKLEILIQDPFDNNLDVKILRGKDSFRLRIGKYRFLYVIKNNKLIIFQDAGSRGDVYK